MVASKRLRNTHVKTQPYPGYPTDMQPQIGVTLALASGTSIVTESIFENRFKYIDELTRMGANVKVEGNSAIITGVEKFTGARVSAPDLRAGAALVIAGLAAEGITVVDDIVYIQRGYESSRRSWKPGAEIERVSSRRRYRSLNLELDEKRAGGSFYMGLESHQGISRGKPSELRQSWFSPCTPFPGHARK